MKETVKGMLDNFIHLIVIDNAGFIQKTPRIYYALRSTPPLFAQMIALYIEKTNDIEWLKNNIDYVEKHYNVFWNKRVITITANDRQYKVASYGTNQDHPRPELWMEDIVSCGGFDDNVEKWICYCQMRGADESGWDFSTRWIYDKEHTTNASKKNADVKRTVPVDLHAIFCQAARLISEFHAKLGNKQKKEEYFDLYKQRLKEMEELFYNSTDGMWYDFDQKLRRHRRHFLLSNFVPLWTDCYHNHRREYHGRRAAEYIYANGVDTFPGGIPTSLSSRGHENWDFPNVFPPLQDIVVTALHKTDNWEAQKLAKQFAKNYVISSLKAWVSTEGGLFDKYNAIEPGLPGQGGEYPVQIGYGWSIGVALSFIDQFERCSSGVVNLILQRLFYAAVFSSIIRNTNMVVMLLNYIR